MIGLRRFLSERLVHFRKMVPLSATFFLYLFAWGLVAPVFNIRINQVTGSLVLSGIIFSLLGFTRIFLDPAFGLLCDRVNPKKLLQLTLFSYIIIFFLYTIVDSFIGLIVVRVLHGVAAGLLWISGWTLVRRKSKGVYAQEEISAWITIQDIAYIIAPLIGGFIITSFTWKPAFYIASVISLISFFYASFRIQSPDVNHNGIKSFRQQFKSFFSNRSSAIRLTLLTLVGYTVYSSFAEFLPIFLNNNGVSIEEISIILSMSFTLPYVLFPIIVGVISDRYGRKIPTIVGLLFMSFGFYSFSYVTSFTQFFFYAFMIFTGDAFISLSLNAELNDLLPDGEAGGFTGIHEMIKDTGFALGPLIAGFIGASLNLRASFITLSIVCLASILILKGFKNY